MIKLNGKLRYIITYIVVYVPILFSIIFFTNFVSQIISQNTEGNSNIIITGNHNIITEKTESIIFTEWNLPQELNHYTKRIDIIKSIWKYFLYKDNEQKILGLSGIAGVGKTTLANNIINNPRLKYKFRGWFNSETKNLLQYDYFELGNQLHLFDHDRSMPVKQKITLVKDWLEKQSDILLVYDNVVNMNILNEYLPLSKGHIIVTSIDSQLPNTIEIDVMRPEEAISLLDYIIPETIKKSSCYQQDLKILVAALGYMPLALSQAGAYISKNSITIQEYLLLYESHRNQILSDDTMLYMDNHTPVYVTWEIIIAKLCNNPDSLLAIKLLNFISYCHSDYIPKEVLAKHLYDKIDNETTYKLNKILKLLKKYSLIKVSTNTVSIHRLVQDFLRDKYTQDKTKHLTQIASVFQSIFPMSDQTTQDIEFIKLILPHLENVLFYMTCEYNRADLMTVLAYAYYIIGNDKKNNSLLKQALEIQKDLDNDSKKISQILHNLGWSYIDLGDYVSAKSVLEEALVRKEKYFGIQSHESASTLHVLGIAYLSLGDYINGKVLIEKALNIRENEYGPNSIKAIYSKHELARAYIYLGQYAKAKVLLEHVLEVKNKYFGSQHFQTSLTLDELGRVHNHLRDFNHAIKFLKQSLKIKKIHYGTEHVKSSYTMHYLGKAYLNLGKYNKAKQLLEKTLEIRKKHFVGKNEHAEIGFTMLELGRIYFHLGDHDSAKKYFKKSFKIISKYFGKNNIKIAHPMHYLGKIYFDLKKYTKAKQFLEDALKIKQNYHDPTHITIAYTRHYLGITYKHLGHYDKARVLLEYALDSKKKHYSAYDVSIIDTLRELSEVYKYLNNDSKAYEMLKQAVK